MFEFFAQPVDQINSFDSDSSQGPDQDNANFQSGLEGFSDVEEFASNSDDGWDDDPDYEGEHLGLDEDDDDDDLEFDDEESEFGEFGEDDDDDEPHFYNDDEEEDY